MTKSVYALLVALLVIISLSMLHDKVMNNAIKQIIPAPYKPVEEKEEVLESFAVDRIQEVKTAKYLWQGLAHACSSGSRQVIQQLINGYKVFFNPSSNDIVCKYRQGRNNCTTHIDTISCVDTNTLMLPSRSGVADHTQLNTLMGPDDTSDCRLYIENGIYKFSKTTVTAFVAFWSAGRNRQFMVMPREDAATRFLMLLRPNYIATGDSQVYWINWAHGHDARYYASWDKRRPNVVLLLEPVNGYIDDRRNPIDIMVSPGWKHEVMKQRKTSVNAPVPMDKTVDLVVYYPQFQHMNETMLNSPGTIMNVRASFNSAFTSVVRSGRTAILSGRWQPGWRHVLVGVRGKGYYRVPALHGGVFCANLANDCLTMSCSSGSSTIVQRVAFSSSIAPVVLSRALQNQMHACIMNAAWLATKYAALMDVPAELVPWDQSVLNDTQELHAGQQLVSANKVCVARMGYDGNLTIYVRNRPRWTTGYTSARANGRVTDASIRLNSSTLQMYDGSGRIFWMSALSHPQDRDDLAPFYATLTNSGELQVRSKKSSAPIWSSRNSRGFIIEDSFQAASIRYQTMHYGELNRRHKGMNPWKHYQQYGRFKGYYWPGPVYA